MVYVDVESDYLWSTGEPVAPNDLLLTIAMGLVDDGLGPTYLKQFWDDVRAYLESHPRPKELGLGLAPLTFKAELDKEPTLRELLRDYARGRSLFERVRDLVNSAQATVRGDKKKGLVLIIDSMDHLSDPSNETGTPVTDSVLRLLREAPELDPLVLHLVLTVPPTVLPTAHDLRTKYGEAFVVPEARVFTRAGSRDMDSFGLLRELVGKRLPVEHFDDSEAVDALIAASGGYLRDLLRLLQDCLLSIDELPITATTVRRAVMRGVHLAAELPLEDYRADLERLLVSQDQRLPRSQEALSRLYRMIRDRVVLRYLNDEAWEGIHPFVLYHVQRDRFQRLVFPQDAAF